MKVLTAFSLLSLLQHLIGVSFSIKNHATAFLTAVTFHRATISKFKELFKEKMRKKIKHFRFSVSVNRSSKLLKNKLL